MRAGPSGLCQPPVAAAEDTVDDEDDEVCCQCNKWSPPGLRLCPDLQIVKWCGCSKCSHWVHLKFYDDAINSPLIIIRSMILQIY